MNWVAVVLDQETHEVVLGHQDFIGLARAGLSLDAGISRIVSLHRWMETAVENIVRGVPAKKFCQGSAIYTHSCVCMCERVRWTVMTATDNPRQKLASPWEIARLEALLMLLDTHSKISILSIMPHVVLLANPFARSPRGEAYLKRDSSFEIVGDSWLEVR